jgi:hypothetical protein
MTDLINKDSRWYQDRIIRLALAVTRLDELEREK